MALVEDSTWHDAMAACALHWGSSTNTSRADAKHVFGKSILQLIMAASALLWWAWRPDYQHFQCRCQTCVWEVNTPVDPGSIRTPLRSLVWPQLQSTGTPALGATSELQHLNGISIYIYIYIYVYIHIHICIHMAATNKFRNSRRSRAAKRTG